MVELSIKSPQEVPAAGGDSSGQGPGSITLRWTEVLTATGGGGVTVRASRTELRESSSQTVLAFAGVKPGIPVYPGAPLVRPVVVTGLGPVVL